MTARSIFNGSSLKTALNARMEGVIVSTEVGSQKNVTQSFADTGHRL